MISACARQMWTKTFRNGIPFENTDGILPTHANQKMHAQTPNVRALWSYIHSNLTVIFGVLISMVQIKNASCYSTFGDMCFSFPHGRCPPLTLPSVALPFTFYVSWPRTQTPSSQTIWYAWICQLKTSPERASNRLCHEP